MTEKKRKTNFPPILYIFIIMTAFFASFTASAYIYLKANDLVFSENEAELKRVTTLLGKKENEIQRLENQLSRYKTLYENELDKAASVFNEQSIPSESPEENE